MTHSLDSLEIQLRDIVAGILTGPAAADALREALGLVRDLEQQAQSLRAQIKLAEDHLVYGPLGRPGNDVFR